MDENDATRAFGALAHQTRLAVFRRLIEAGPSGLPAGEIARAGGIPASTMSGHLAVLERAGLARSWRVARQIFYAADIEGTRRLLTFLVQDCCEGRPDMCGDLGRLANACAPVKAGTRT